MPNFKPKPPNKLKYVKKNKLLHWIISIMN